MHKFTKKIEQRIDDLNIKKKLYFLYICCVLFPLFLTDGMIISVVVKSERSSRQHDMENVANAVKYNLTNDVESVASLAKSIYMNEYIDEFLERDYESALAYITSYQSFFKDTLFESGIGVNNYQITLYSDNDTIINGGTFCRLSEIVETDWYQYMQQSGRDKILFFTYDTNRQPVVDAQRRILFVQRLDFYGVSQKEKLLKIEMDYSGFMRRLVKMNYDFPVYICQGDSVLLSNATASSVKKDFDWFQEREHVGYTQKISLYGSDLQLYILKQKTTFGEMMSQNLPVIVVLVLVNIVLPFMFVQRLNHSFTQRLSELGEAFGRVEDERLTEIASVRGKDEIGTLMRNYNRMVRRINELIQMVYINRIQEQEMLVAQKNAELLALHSQINPHFLFNALESIRMHSILKKEFETADMVEKLAIMQRQYVDWGEDFVEIDWEMEFVEAYLGLQKYRFGERLSYEIMVEPGCGQCRIPKLTVVTFVENACVHGIEGKQAPGWIFVRIGKRNNKLCIEVEDTGVGMDETAMQNLLAKMQQANIDMLKEKQRVGVINACLRLKMATQGEVEFCLEGEEGVGMQVQILFPVLGLEGEEKDA